MNQPSTTSRRPRIYFAGPDVFRLDSSAVFSQLVATCEQLGMEALVPSDDIPGASFVQAGVHAQRIYEANVEKLRRADGVIANLQSFRALEPDSGTVFEVGFAVALQLPVVGYGVPQGTYGARVQAAMACTRHADGVLREQANSMMVEELAQELNLMLSRSITIVDSADSALALLAQHFCGRAP